MQISSEGRKIYLTDHIFPNYFSAKMASPIFTQRPESSGESVSDREVEEGKPYIFNSSWMLLIVIDAGTPRRSSLPVLSPTSPNFPTGPFRTTELARGLPTSHQAIFSHQAGEFSFGGAEQDAFGVLRRDAELSAEEKQAASLTSKRCVRFDAIHMAVTLIFPKYSG